MELVNAMIRWGGFGILDGALVVHVSTELDNIDMCCFLRNMGLTFFYEAMEEYEDHVNWKVKVSNCVKEIKEREFERTCRI